MIPEIERKAVLALFPYFSKSPVVVDVGSNIGDWASVLAPNVEQIRLFEPNTILRHYSQVRFRALKNVWYSSFALADRVGVVEFHYFEDDHDGLSNIINNPKWDYLQPKMEIIDCTTLDEFRMDYIDLLKIDAEGAEYMILQGAKNLLEEKRIKFIEVEYGEHIKHTGINFGAIIHFMYWFGYWVFHFDGNSFIRVEGAIENYNAENFYFMDKNFSENWNLEFIENTKGMRLDFVLEIGAFEGLTSRYICDNLLNTGGRMIAVDPLTDEYLPGHKDNAMFVGQYDRFMRNTKGYPIELIRKKSKDAFEELKDYRFDLIYVDGDHTKEAVYQDAMKSFFITRQYGHILFDDYNGYSTETKEGIDRFVHDMGPERVRVVKEGYQMLVQKLVTTN
jgi:FkbM family methyltransferase